MQNEDMSLVAKRVSNRLGEHFTDLHNTLAKYDRATTRHQQKLLAGIGFYLAKISEHRHEPAVIRNDFRKEAILAAQMLLVGEHEAGIMKEIRQLNALIMSGVPETSYMDGNMSRRSLLLTQLSKGNILHSLPWLH